MLQGCFLGAGCQDSMSTCLLHQRCNDVGLGLPPGYLMCQINLDLYARVPGSIQCCVTFAFITCGGLCFRSFILVMSSVSHLLRQAQMWKQIPLGKEEDLEAEVSNKLIGFLPQAVPSFFDFNTQQAAEGLATKEMHLVLLLLFQTIPDVHPQPEGCETCGKVDLFFTKAHLFCEWCEWCPREVESFCPSRYSLSCTF